MKIKPRKRVLIENRINYFSKDAYVQYGGQGVSCSRLYSMEVTLDKVTGDISKIVILKDGIAIIHCRQYSI